MKIPPNMSCKNTSAILVKTMGIRFCGYPALAITGTIQTIASRQVLQPIALKTKLLKTMNIISIDVTVVAPAQEASLMTVMIAKTAIANQPFATAMAKAAMPRQLPIQGSTVLTVKTQITYIAIIYMMMTCGERNRNICLSLSLT